MEVSATRRPLVCQGQDRGRRDAGYNMGVSRQTTWHDVQHRLATLPPRRPARGPEQIRDDIGQDVLRRAQGISNRHSRPRSESGAGFSGNPGRIPACAGMTSFLGGHRGPPLRLRRIVGWRDVGAAPRGCPSLRLDAIGTSLGETCCVTRNAVLPFCPYGEYRTRGPAPTFCMCAVIPAPAGIQGYCLPQSLERRLSHC
jgi:hypothetical protein